MAAASEVIFALKPVSFRYHKEYDSTQTLAVGLIAEEVSAVAPHFVGRNPEGQPESVRYEQINAMSLNEFLKEHQKVQELEATIAKQQKDFQATATGRQMQIETLTADLRKVSDQLELRKFAKGRIRSSGPAPHPVAEDP